MIPYLLFTSLAFGHSGGTDAYGCHAGSQPYHCHGNTHIDFDSVDIKGEIIKPSIQYVQEEIRVDPCAKHVGTDEWVECSINLSYEEISSLCDMTRTNPTQVKAYLDVLSKISLLELIYESTGKDGWQYRYNPEEDAYWVVNSPGGKWNGKKLPKNTKGYDNVYNMHSKLLTRRVTTVPSEDYKDKKVTTWQSCSSNGLDMYDEHWYTQVRDNNDSFGQFVAWPTPVGTCKDGETFESWGRGGQQRYCREFDGPLSMSKTIYTKDPSRQNEMISHHFEMYGGLISMPDVWKDVLAGEAGSYILPISSTMYVVVNETTNEFGIVYRRVHNQEGLNRAGGPMVFEPEASAAIFKEVLEPPMPAPDVIKPENKWVGPLAVAGFVAGMVFIINQHGGF